MKKFIVLFIMVFAVLCFAEETINFTPSTTLIEVSTQTNIPVKKIAQYLKLEDQTKYNLSLQEIGVSSEDVSNALAEYETNKKSFYTGITLVGMGIVFTSLLLAGFIISLLKYIGKPKNNVNIVTSVGTVTAPQKHLNSNGVVAAITAMFLHDAEEKDKIDLTWKRQTSSMWKAAGMIENRIFEDRRGRR